ncbi:MAG: YigZ family protein, partial [Bacteroidota bacterium]|nr:YigZ family protein [Bacteroidota bacterium]
MNVYLCFMQTDSYQTIGEASEGLYREKGSKFLAFAHPVASIEDVKSILENYRKHYYDARHICYAYRIGPAGEVFRVNDDGEPSGTAGRPIFGQLLSFNLTNTLVVVVRYFGGVLLGTGGLTVAYKAAANSALSAAELVTKTVDVECCIRFEFPFLDMVLRLMRKAGAQMLSQTYDSGCCIRLSV